MGCWTTSCDLGHLKAHSKVSVFFTMILIFTYLFYCLTGYCDSMPSPLYVHQNFRSKLFPKEGKKLALWNGSIVRELPEQDATDVEDKRRQRALAYDTYSNLSVSDNFGTKEFPQAIIIGVKKGGTRALLEFLRVHPDVRAVGAEPHFFDRFYEKGLQWYRWVACY